MEYSVAHPRFQQKQLTVETQLLFAPKLLVDGAEAKRSLWGKYKITDDSGHEVVVKLRNGLDLQPRVEIAGGEPIKLGEGLPGYAYVFVWGPLLLALVGGAIGGAFGGVACVMNAAVFRSELPTAAKIGASIAIAIAAGIAWLVAAGALHVAIAALSG